jgi:hypothetical protein
MSADRGYRSCHHCGQMHPITETMEWLTIPRGDGTVGYIGPFCDADCAAAWRRRATVTEYPALTVTI